MEFAEKVKQRLLVQVREQNASHNSQKCFIARFFQWNEHYVNFTVQHEQKRGEEGDDSQVSVLEGNSRKASH